MKYGIDAAVTPGTWTIPADVRAVVDAMEPADYEAFVEDVTSWYGVGERCGVMDLADYMRGTLNVW